MKARIRSGGARDVAAAGACLLALLLLALLTGCGAEESGPTLTPLGTSATAKAGAGEASSAASAASSPAQDRGHSLDGALVNAFSEAASALAPVPVYAPTVLPPGSALAPGWWSLLTEDHPPPPADSTLANPRLVRDSAEPQAEILVETPDGWIVFLQNFRGDLGDVQGEPAGEVCGHALMLYHMAGGILAQWSDGGRWYGIFGKGEVTEQLSAIACTMRVFHAHDDVK